MNAPAKITPARDLYIPQVKAFVSLCDGEELTLRCSILFCRDSATANMRTCGEEAHGILLQVQRLAADYAYTSMTIDRLRMLRAQVVRLVSVASSLDLFDYMGEHPDHGGRNAGE